MLLFSNMIEESVFFLPLCCSSPSVFFALPACALCFP
uniref:Uncharacterized protein n=1 Tax=Rhizophora mucronata TaxID=61149 RepID=A0A2P2NZP8_RHIMU